MVETISIAWKKRGAFLAYSHNALGSRPSMPALIIDGALWKAWRHRL